MIASIRLMVCLLVTVSLGYVGARQINSFRKAFPPNRLVGSLLEPAPEESRRACARIRAKTEIIERLRRGELTLFEAAAWFRLLYEQGTAKERQQLNWYEGASLNERACRQVIRWAETELANRMADSEWYVLLCDLETELRQHLADNNGRVILPGFDDEPAEAHAAPSSARLAAGSFTP